MLATETGRYVDRWATLDHKNVAKCYGYTHDCGVMPALVMQYYARGNVIEYLKEKIVSFSHKIHLVINSVLRACNTY